MATLNVNPEHLDKLAGKMDDAQNQADYGAKKADSIPKMLWLTHGVISFDINLASGGCATERRKAGLAIRDVAERLAASLRAAALTYAGVDGELHENLDTQLRSQ